MENINLITQSKTLKNFIKKNKKDAKCVLLVSSDEELLNPLAKYLTMAIMCKSEYPCLKCNNCLKILNNTAIEVHEYPNNKKNKKQILVEDINEVVDTLIETTLDFDKKIYIFNRIDESTQSAQNKLLKSMEEFPEYCVMIFTASNIKQILPTVLSRLIVLNVPSLPVEEYENILKSVSKEDNNSLPISTIYDLSSGNLFLGYSMLNDEKEKQIYNNCLEILNKIDKTNILDYSLLISKGETREYLKVFSVIISKMLLNKADLSTSYSVINKKFTIKSLVNIANCIDYSYKKIKSNTNEQSIIDNLLINIMEAKI